MTTIESGSIPGPVKLKIEGARLLMEACPPRYEMSRNKGGLEINHMPPRLEIDNRAFFDSIGLKSLSALAKDLIEKSRRAALDGTERYAIEGDILASSGSGGIVPIALSRSSRSIETMLVFIPESAPEISFSEGRVDTEYTPDRLFFKWQLEGVKTDYIPYCIEYHGI